MTEARCWARVQLLIRGLGESSVRGPLGRVRSHIHKTSNKPAAPMPPPTHIVTTT
jgi:hypothetical protein